jgi:replicative DNA helicase
MSVQGIQLETFFKEGLRRILAEEDESDTLLWARTQLDRMGGADESAVLTWPESFDYTDALVAKYEELARLPAEQRQVLDWKWKQWNTYIMPLEAGMLATLTAPDGMGKSTYAEMIAEHWAEHRNRVCYVHYELNKAVMMQRRLARHALVTVRDIRSGQLTPEQKARVRAVRPMLAEWAGQITYIHAPGWTMERTVDELRKQHAEGACDAVVVDYLEKVAASSRQMKMRMEWFQREADNVEQLKTFAESVGVPVVMVAQMRKDAKSKDMAQVGRGDMRGAGEKSEKANLVVLLNRKREADGYSNEVDVLIDKNTMGQAGVQFKQLMRPEYFDVRDLVTA